MTNREIDNKMFHLVKTERKITREVLELIQLAEQRRVPLQLGFKDTYDWLITGHGYSGAAANRRIQASRLLREVPEAASKVENGSLNLTILAEAQKNIRAQQKATGRKVSVEEKKAALIKITDKTSKPAERELNTLFRDGVKSGEAITHKRDGGVRFSIELTAEEAQTFERAKELLSHTLPGATNGRIVARLAKKLVQRKDPLCKKSATAPQRSIGSAKRVAIQKARGRCEYVHPTTGRSCGSTFQVELDHIIPRAKGGSDEPSNLRCLCRRHNQLMAEIEFGREFMDRYRYRS